MWTLETDGNSLAYKKIWLRPGKRYLFGRTRPTDKSYVAFRIDHKTVSRKHITLCVSEAKPGDSSNTRTRSEVTLKDEGEKDVGTKFRTEVDGVSIKNESRVLKKDEHVFRLGSSPEVFRLKWQPVVFTFSLTTKETKASKDPLAAYRDRVEKLDIKVIVPYITEATTHVVAGKRNTAKGLQALINAKYIVTERFIDNVIEVTTPKDLDNEESLSKLEEDFDAHWPNPSEYLPDKSREPSERPAIEFCPNPERGKVFEGYTFIFCDELQYDTLQAPITNGGGKALHCLVVPGETSSEDIVRYVKSAAGEKGLGEFEDGSEGKGVVVVKFRGKGKHVDWAARLDYEVAQALDLRLIEQSEFLDAILVNDASMLRRPLLPNEDDTLAANTVSQQLNIISAPIKDSPSKAAQSAHGRKSRGPIVSRFKGFDDDDDDFSIGGSAVPASARSQGVAGLSEGCSQHLSNRTSFPDAESIEDTSMDHPNNDNQKENSRKRAAPVSDDENQEDLVDQLLPATTAMKRRRIELEAEAGRNGVSPDESFEMPQRGVKPAKKAKLAKEVNIKDVVRECREAEEAAAKRDEENLREALDGMTVEQMKNLAVVEEMDVPQRQPPTLRTIGEHDSRWDERWNGRKNFKKFRRRGEVNQPRRGQSVIVALEEVKNKDYGIGEDYWLQRENEGAKKKRKERERRMQSQSQQAPSNSVDSHVAEIPLELMVDDGTNVPETIDVDAPRITRHQEKTQNTEESSASRPSQVLSEKRSARNQLPTLPLGPKKRKKFAAARDSDNDSEDEDEDARLRFTKRAR